MSKNRYRDIEGAELLGHNGGIYNEHTFPSY
jgi:hypothetical protein